MKASIIEIATFNANERVMRDNANLEQARRAAQSAMLTPLFDRRFKQARKAFRRANK